MLDNCEHLLGACAELADHLLGTCARLTTLATSREPLGIAGEVAWRVPTLAVPDPTEDASIECMAGRDAVRLFLERTSSVLPGFTLTQQNARAVSEVCRRLDGLPLAIELAAARVRVLGPEQIAERLDDRFRLLTGGSRTAPLRQQTLRATLEWSYDLLSDAERLLFDRLSVFAGGWTLESAEAVCAGEAVEPGAVLDVLTQLVDKSLVLAEPGPAGAIRYRLLETLRQYGQERLGDRDDVEETRRRHAVFFLALAERAARELRGSEQRSWLALLAHEQDNFRAALVWSIGRGESEIGPRLAAAPAEFWQRRAYVSKDLEWLLRGLEHGDVGSAAVRAPGLQAAAFLAYFQGDDEAAHAYLAESLALWQQLGEERGIADTLRGLGMTALGRGELDRAEAPLLASLDRFRALEDSLGIAACLGNLGDLAHARGDVTQAAALFEESLALAREQGNTWQAAYVLHSLGHLALVRGNQARATALLREGLALSGELEDRRAIAVCLDSLALVACGQRQPERAARLFGASEGLRAAMGVGRRAWLRVDFDRGVAAARAALGEAAFAAAWAAGRSLSAAQAIEYALGSDAPAADEPAPYAAPSPRAASRLTRREREVAALLARGLSNRQIAAALVIAEGTAANHVKHILARLGLDSRAQVATWAIEHGLHLPSPS